MSRRFLALSAHLGILAILLAAPTILWHTIPAIPRVSTWSQLGALLASQDDGILALAAIWLVAVVCWIILAALIVTEGIAGLRGIRTRRIPGLALPQQLARHLIATAALLYLASSTNPAPTSEPVLAAAGPAVAVADPAAPDAVALAAPKAAPSAPSKQPDTVTHVVKQGESLWRIAESHLGSGRRYREIVALNRHLLAGNPDFLKPGWVLRLPAPSQDPDPKPDTTLYTVRKGDNLSQIAQDTLGDAHRWPEIAKASADIRQPGGRHLTDPDEIDIGWKLAIPGGGKIVTKTDQPTHRPKNNKPDRPGDSSATPMLPPTAPSPTSPSTRAETPGLPGASAMPSSEAEEQSTDDFTPNWLLPGLAGSGFVLAGSLYVALRRRRSLQFRYRRPGRTITAPPPQALPAEKTLISLHEQATDRIEAVHHALLGLAAQLASAEQDMPQLVALELTTGDLGLHLAESIDLPEPWIGSGTHWRITYGQVRSLPTPEDGAPSPYPLLVTIGTAADDTTWLSNLEQLGTLSVSGGRDAVNDLLRHVAAELAVNPWSRDVTTYLGETWTAVQPMNPQRIRTADDSRLHERLLSEAIHQVDHATDAGLDLPTARARQAGADLWPAAVLIAQTEPSRDAAEQLRQLARSQARRTGIVVLSAYDEPGAVLDVDDSGSVTVPGTGVAVHAVGLTPDEAAGCAALLAAASDLDDQPIPDSTGLAPLEQYTSQGGALRDRLAGPRPHATAAGSSSLLPDPDDQYLSAATTTSDDLQRLAPPIADQASAEILALDPTLDDDLAAWQSDNCPLPRLSILGPVTARCGPNGTAAAANNHLSMLTEILTVLATRSHGTTTDALAEAVGISPARVRKEVMLLREWLGTNPLTGRPHIPDARQTKTALATGTPAYEVEDLLVDADLFRRLRARAQAKGERGIADLSLALSLVEGEPLTRLRNGSWLDQGERLDQHLTCAVADVAHIVTTSALQGGDLELARAAAETACRAAPYDETARLDLAAVAEAEGHADEARRIVSDQILNRDDDEGYPDLPERSEQVINRRGWRQNRRHAG